MKKFLYLLIVLALAVSVASCKKKTDETVNSTEPVKQVEASVSDFYKKVAESKSRPVAVMIDNDSDAARPQSGLEDAFVIYEMKVEGIASRMMALFLDSKTEKIGPVRSSRHYFLDYALENDAIYTHCGYSPQAQSDIVSLDVDNINEINANNGKNFFRDSSKRAPHNLYTSISELTAYAQSIGYDTETDSERVFSFREKDEELQGEQVNEISLPYHSQYIVSYKYNADKKVYERYINSQPHMSESSGEVLTAKNIIVYKVENYTVDSVGRQEMENIGSGSGYYISGGKSIPIVWSKESRRGKTVYETESGEKLMLNPGNVYVQIIPANEEIILK